MSSHPWSREENGSTSDTGRETGMLMVQIFQREAAEVQRVSTALLRLQLVLNEVRKEAKPVWWGINLSLLQQTQLC